MGQPINLAPKRLSSKRLPQRFPVGATYVVEGFGGDEGDLRVIARYIVLPGGQRINVPADLFRPAAPSTLAFRRRTHRRQSQGKSRLARGGKKLASRNGTG